MVQLSLFENSVKSQTLRTLISLAIIIPMNLFYIKISESNLSRFMNNKLAFFNVWITLSIVFGVSLLSKTDTNTIIDSTDYQMKNYTYYGILIGLLIYVPLYNWLISSKVYKPISGFISNIFGILMSGVTCLIVYLISSKTDLLN